MSDLLAERCASLKDLVLELMQVAIGVQAHEERLVEVPKLTARIRAVVELGSAGVDSADYAAWLDVANGNLLRMEKAAESGEALDIWAAFTDPATGFNQLGVACAGQPGW